MDAQKIISKLQNSIISYASNPSPKTLVEDVINKSFENINSYLFDKDKLTIGIGDNGLFLDDHLFTKKETGLTFIKSFNDLLTETKIARIMIYRDITMREYIHFISLLSRNPGYFKNQDEVKVFIKSKSLRNIGIDFLQEQEPEIVREKKKAVILDNIPEPEYEEDQNTSHEIFDPSETGSLAAVNTAADQIREKAHHPFIAKFDSIIDHISKDVESSPQKQKIIRNMIDSLSPESILDLIDEYHKRNEASKINELIYPYIDHEKFLILSSHILMLINDELYFERKGGIDFPYCERLRDVLIDIASRPHLSKSSKALSKCKAADILILHKKKPDEPILSRAGLLKGKINVNEIVNLLFMLDLEFSVLDHKNFSDIIINELLENLEKSKDPIVEEGFRRIIKGLLDASLENAMSYFSNIIRILFDYIDKQKALSPLYNFACETAVYYSPVLIKKGNMAVLRDILKVLNHHRDTRSERSAEQWYKARLTINSIGQSQSMRDLIASFFWMEEKKRSEILLTLLLIKETAVKYLLSLLSESKEIKSRKSLISSLITLGKDSVPEIISELSRKQPWYYLRNLILILGKINTPEVSAYIKEFLNHEDKRVRKEAINALVSLKDPVANSYLIPYLSNEAEEDVYIIKKVISALEYSKPEDVSFLLFRILNDEIYTARETEEEDLKQACCYVAGKLKIKEAVPILKKFLYKRSIFGINKGHTDHLRAAAIYALHMIGGEEEEIKRHLKDESAVVRSVVKEILKP